MSNVTNQSNADNDYDESLLKKLEIICLSIIFILAVLGNSCVIIALLTRSKKLSRMNYFVMHLSVADLVVAFTSVLTQLVTNARDKNGIVRIHNDFLCRLYAYGQLLPLFASTYMLVIIAIDRYKAICTPLSTYSWTKKRSRLMVFAAWVVSVLGSSPQLAIFHYDAENGRCNDIFSSNLNGFKVYVTCLIIALLIVPVFVLVILYGFISYTVWKSISMRNKPEMTTNESPLDDSSSKNKKNTNVIVPRTHSRRGYSRAKIRTVVMTSIIVVTFIVCWTPYWIGNAIWAFMPEAEAGSVTIKVLVLLSALNSCTNPWIYMIFNFNTILKSCPRQRRSTNNTSIYSSRFTTQKSILNDKSENGSMIEMTPRDIKGLD